MSLPCATRVVAPRYRSRKLPHLTLTGSSGRVRSLTARTLMPIRLSRTDVTISRGAAIRRVGIVIIVGVMSFQLGGYGSG